MTKTTYCTVTIKAEYIDDGKWEYRSACIFEAKGEFAYDPIIDAVFDWVKEATDVDVMLKKYVEWKMDIADALRYAIFEKAHDYDIVLRGVDYHSYDWRLTITAVPKIVID